MHPRSRSALGAPHALRRFGDAALLLEPVAADASVDDALTASMAWYAALEDSRPEGVIGIVPAARTILVRIDPARTSLTAVRSWVVHTAGSAREERPLPRPEAVLDIRYDGPDLDETARVLGVSTEALVARHSGIEWRVAFTGFAPGFGYLVSADWPFDVPRLATPRTRVPVGAVGLAAGFAGAYPRATPGGWRLIGTTSTTLFTPDADPPARLTPGTRVRFRAASGREMITLPAHASPGGSGDSASNEVARVDAVGGLVTVQDMGRLGAAKWGVSGSGALDRAAARRANRMVGNAENAATLEITMGGFRATALVDTWIALTGARGAVTVDGCALVPDVPRLWRAGQTLETGWFTAGARAYLGVRGGIEAPTALGSRSTDTLSGLGPTPIVAEAVVCRADDIAGPVPAVDIAPWSSPPDDIAVRVCVGPREDWFAPDALRTLGATSWTVDAAADRVGIRLQGPALARTVVRELPSEGMVPGAVQVPPGGAPTILLADGPVTGGYPVIGAVVDADLDLLAQARPGSRIRFIGAHLYRT